MTQDPNASPPPVSPEPAKTPPAPRRRRRWPIVLGVLLLGLVLLVAMAPTLAGTSPVRSYVLGLVNKQINGRVDATGWSVGWLSGARLDGLRVYDRQDNLMVEVQQVRSGLTLLGAIGGGVDLGDLVVDVNAPGLLLSADGQLNLALLAGAADASPPAVGASPVQSTPAAAAAPASAAPKDQKLPNVKGKLTLKLRGRVAGEGLPEPVTIEPSVITLDIPALDQPIRNDIRLALRSGDGPVGTITLAGEATIASAGTLSLDRASGTQSLVLQSLDLSAASAALRAAGQPIDLAGVGSGSLQINAASPQQITAAGELLVADPRLAGGPLAEGETFSAGSIRIPVRATLGREGEQAVVQVQRTGLLIDDGKLASILLDVSGPQSTLAEAAAALPQVLQAALSPGSASTVAAPQGAASAALRAELDLAALARQLPRTLALAEGVSLTAGRITHETTVAIDGARTTLATTTSLPDLAGANQGRPVALQPVTLKASAVAAATNQPELRDLAIDLASGFATAKGGGPTLSYLSVDGRLDLPAVQAQLGQFIDLDRLVNGDAAAGRLRLSGVAFFKQVTDGDLRRPGGSAKTWTAFNVQGLRIEGVGDLPPIEQPELLATIGGVLRRGDDAARVRSFDDVTVTFRAGREQSPTVDAQIKATIDVAAGTAPAFEIVRLSAPDLARLQAQIEPFVPALRASGIRVAAGSLHAAGAGSFADGAVALTRPLVVDLPGLSVQRTVDGRVATLLDNETLALRAAGTIAAGDRTAIDLSELALSSSSGLASLTKSAAQPFNFAVDASGAVSGRGALDLSADLARVMRLVQAVSGAEPPVDLRSGVLTATAAIAPDPAAGTTINLDGVIDRLTIVTDVSPIENETLSLSAAVVSPANAGALKVNASLASAFVTARLGDAILQTDASGLDAVRNATVEVAVKDLPRLYNVVTAFAPVAAGVDADGRPLPPLQVIGGGAAIAATVARDPAARTTTVQVSDFRVSKLALQRGVQSYRFDRDNPISLKLAAVIGGAEQVESVRISQMSGDLRVASLEMPEPITLTNLAGDPQAAGAIRLAGALEPLTRLLAVVQGGDPLPYRGQIALNQRVATSGQTIRVAGDLGVEGLEVLGADGRAAFTERRVTLANDVAADLAGKTLSIAALDLRMPDSGALSLAAKGRVVDWETRRQFDGVSLNLGYDLQKLWSLLYPMLDAETQKSLSDLRLAGRYERAISVGGSLPADKPFPEAVRSLTADGALAVGLLSASGITIEQFEQPFALRDGVLTLGQATPATLNGGRLDLGGLRVDLTQPTPRLSSDANKAVIANAGVPPLLATTILGDVIPLFGEGAGAGALNVTLVECERLPLGELLTLTADPATGERNDGRAEIVVSAKDVQPGGPLVGALLQVTGAAFGQSLQGEIPESRIRFENGVVRQDTLLAYGQKDRQALRFRGGIALADLRYDDFEVVVPATMVRRFDRNLLKYLPEGITLPVGGTVSRPQLRADFIGPLASEAAAKLAADSLLGGQQKPAEGQEGQRPRGGELIDLLNQLGGQKRDKPEEKKP